MANVEVLLTRQDVAEMCGLSIETVKDYRKRGILPPPDQMYGRTPLWRRKTIQKWRSTVRPYGWNTTKEVKADE